MSSTLDLNGGTTTLAADSTTTYLAITDTSTNHDGTLVMNAGATLIFDDSDGAGFLSAATAITITINGNADSPCTIKSASSNPDYPWTLPATTTALTATRCKMRDYTGTRYSTAWVLNNIDWGDWYASADNVISFLRLYDPSTGTRWADSTTSDPTINELEDWLCDATDYIDQVTQHAWREVLVEDEYHDVELSWTGHHEYDLPIKLNHRQIRDISSSTDKIEVWNGSSWIDFVDTYTEGRGSDYWFDYAKGILYFADERPYYHEAGVRVTYRYGGVGVPNDIREACIKLVAIKFLESDWFKIVVPEGSGLENRKLELTDRWRRDVDRILMRRREPQLIGAF